MRKKLPVFKLKKAQRKEQEKLTRLEKGFNLLPFKAPLEFSYEIPATRKAIMKGV